MWELDCEESWAIKDARLLLGRKTMTNLDSILKSRDISLPTKVHLFKSMIFAILIYGCESWTIKKTEHQRTDIFKRWCYRRLDSSLEYNEIKSVNPKRNQRWVLIARTDAEVEAPIFWSPDMKNWLIRKDPDAWKGGEGDDRGWDGWMASSTRWAWVWASSRSWWWTAKPGVLQSLGWQRVRHDWMTELNWSKNSSPKFMHWSFRFNFHGMGTLIFIN